MFKLVSGVVGFVGATLLFWCGIAYCTYLPAGWPNYRVALWTIHLPWAGEVGAERAKLAWANAQWSQCRANEAVQSAAMARQEAAVQALASEGQRRTAAASSAVQQAEKRALGRDQEIAAIQNIKPLGPDLCSDALAVIHAVPQ